MKIEPTPVKELIIKGLIDGGYTREAATEMVDSLLTNNTRNIPPTPPVEDIREIIRDALYGHETIDDGYDYNEAVDEVAALFSTILDGLVMEDQIFETATSDVDYIKYIASECKKIGYNDAVRELNQRLATIQKSLKGE